jgi:hypothetical protein
MAVDSTQRMLLSPRLKLKSSIPLHKAAFFSLPGRKITLPEKFLPKPDYLQFHLENIFQR